MVGKRGEGEGDCSQLGGPLDGAEFGVRVEDLWGRERLALQGALFDPREVQDGEAPPVCEGLDRPTVGRGPGTCAGPEKHDDRGAGLDHDAGDRRAERGGRPEGKRPHATDLPGIQGGVAEEAVLGTQQENARVTAWRVEFEGHRVQDEGGSDLGGLGALVRARRTTVK